LSTIQLGCFAIEERVSDGFCRGAYVEQTFAGCPEQDGHCVIISPLSTMVGLRLSDATDLAKSQAKANPASHHLLKE
jgi:hypothetical protein